MISAYFSSQIQKQTKAVKDSSTPAEPLISLS